MSSHFYEVALFGEFFAQDLKPIVNRITLHSESSQQMHYREFVFEPIDAPQQRELGNEPVLLRARKEVTSPDSKWYTSHLLTSASSISTVVDLCDGRRVLYSYLKPESARVHPEATVRPWSTLEIDGDAMAFASALGYMCVEYLETYVKPHSLVTLEGGLRYTNADTCSARGVWSSRCSNKSRFDHFHPRR